MPRGYNLKAGHPDGDRGRRKGGRARVRKYAKLPIDDSGRTYAQYWGFLTFVRLVEQHGEDGARAILSRRGQAAFAKERADYTRYLRSLRQPAQKG